MTAEEFSAAIKIDREALHEECSRHVEVYDAVSGAATEARSKEDRLSSELKELEADLSYKIRMNPEGFGIDKITDAKLQSTIIMQPVYKEVRQALTQAKHEREIQEGRVYTMAHRKSMLEMLVKLHLNNYYGVINSGE